MTRWLVALSIGLGCVLGSGCDRAPSYSQGTADDVVESAVKMIRNGDARLLTKLIYADSDEMRIVLDRLGVLLGHIQELADALAKAFPDRVEALKQRAVEEASASGGRLSIFIGPGGPGAGLEGDREDRMKEAVARVFADPYGWLDRGAEKLSTVGLADDLASVLYDDKPIFPPVGVALKLDNGRWYVALPTHLPPLSEAMPRTREQWSIIASVIKVLDNTAVEMTADVRSGNVRSPDELAEKAWEKLVFPGIIAMGAYGREMDVQSKFDRRNRDFQKRKREWIKARSDEAKAGGAAALPSDVIEVIDRIAAKEIEALARRGGRADFADLSGPEFERRLEGWCTSAGLTVKLNGDMPPEALSAAAASWKAADDAAKAKRRSGK